MNQNDIGSLPDTFPLRAKRKYTEKGVACETNLMPLEDYCKLSLHIMYGVQPNVCTKMLYTRCLRYASDLVEHRGLYHSALLECRIK